MNWKIWKNLSHFIRNFYHDILKALKIGNSKFYEVFLYILRMLIIKRFKTIQNWYVSNVINFSNMFSNCLLLSDIESLKSWNVLNGKDFSNISTYYSSLKNIKSIKLEYLKRKFILRNLLWMFVIIWYKTN